MADLRHLRTAWDVDRTIVLEEQKVVVVRFSATEVVKADDVDDQTYANHIATAEMDAALAEIATRMSNYCRIFAVDTTEVPDFNEMFELQNPREAFAVLFFFRNKHIKVDLGTGNTNKLNFVVDPSDLCDIIEGVFVAGGKGKGISDNVKKFPNVAGIAR